MKCKKYIALCTVAVLLLSGCHVETSAPVQTEEVSEISQIEESSQAPEVPKMSYDE